MVSFTNNSWHSLRQNESVVPYSTPETLAFIEQRREAHTMVGAWLEAVMRRSWSECPLGRVMDNLKHHFELLWDG